MHSVTITTTRGLFEQIGPTRPHLTMLLQDFVRKWCYDNGLVRDYPAMYWSLCEETYGGAIHVAIDLDDQPLDSVSVERLTDEQVEDLRTAVVMFCLESPYLSIGIIGDVVINAHSPKSIGRFHKKG